MAKKLKKVKGKKSSGIDMPEVYKPTLHFDDKQLSGLKEGKIGQKLNMSIQGRLKRISQETYDGKDTLSYSLEIDKMSLPALEKKLKGKKF